MARPPHKPTDQSRVEVQTLASVGIVQEEIAAYVGVSQRTLRKHYRDELDNAATKANASVARALYSAAVQDRNTSAMIFWLKARAGWSEKQHIDVTTNGESLHSARGKIKDAAPADLARMYRDLASGARA